MVIGYKKGYRWQSGLGSATVENYSTHILKMNPTQQHSLFTDFDINLFKAGKHFRLYEKMGTHLTEINGVKGVYFAVWAPAAKSVSVIGDFNGWKILRISYLCDGTAPESGKDL